MRTIRLTIAYDGTDYVGWQRQESGASIQGLIEDALARIDGDPVTLHGAGRTDAGVHALGQVASARVRAALDDGTLGRALNAHLPEAIRVREVTTVADDFHARFSATGKTYEYRIWNGSAVPPFERLYLWRVAQRMDRGLIDDASRAIVGSHDFAAFQGAGSTTHSTVRRVTRASWRRGPDNERLIFEITGEGFLRHMVRSLVGTLVEIGHGRRPATDMRRLLETPARDQVGRTAPALGLVLVRVDYPEGSQETGRSVL